MIDGGLGTVTVLKTYNGEDVSYTQSAIWTCTKDGYYGWAVDMKNADSVWRNYKFKLEYRADKNSTWSDWDEKSVGVGGNTTQDAGLCYKEWCTKGEQKRLTISAPYGMRYYCLYYRTWGYKQKLICTKSTGNPICGY